MTQTMAPAIEQEHCLSERVPKDASLRLRDRVDSYKTASVCFRFLSLSFSLFLVTVIWVSSSLFYNSPSRHTPPGR